MRVITDCPGHIGGWFGGCAWQPAAGPGLSDEERRLWDALGGGPDPCVADRAQGATDFFARAIITAEAPGSQFDAVNRLLQSGCRLSGSLACVALQGRNFHGQRGRSWAAAPGNLHLVAAFRSDDLPAQHGMALTMLAALAVCDGVRAATDGRIQPQIKWVNDILVAERKIAGVISTTQVLRRVITQFVLGIGLNVAAAPSVPPTAFVPAVGSLAGAGADVPLGAVFQAVLAALAGWYGVLRESGPSRLLEAYRSRSAVIGREVAIWDEAVDLSTEGSPLPPPLIRGRVRDIRPDLSLLMEGSDVPVARGRLAFAEFVG